MTGARSATAVVAVAFALTGCAVGERLTGDQVTSPMTSTPEATMSLDAVHVVTLKKGTRGAIAVEPKQIIAAVPNVTSDGRTALAVTIQGKGSHGDIYLKDGEDFEIEGIAFHIETNPSRGEVTVYQLADDADATTPSPE